MKTLTPNDALSCVHAHGLSPFAVDCPLDKGTGAAAPKLHPNSCCRRHWLGASDRDGCRGLRRWCDDLLVNTASKGLPTAEVVRLEVVKLCLLRLQHLHCFRQLGFARIHRTLGRRD